MPRDPVAFDLSAALLGLARVELDAFLGSRARLSFTPAEVPLVSVVVMGRCDQPELLLRCVRSLACTNIDLEIFLQTEHPPAGPLVERIGCRVLPAGRGPLDLALVLRTARAPRLLLVGHDVELGPSSLERGLETLQSGDVGAVGGKQITTDGRLVSAGGIVYRDGSLACYKHGDRSLSPETLFQRDVDFAERSWLLLSRGAVERCGDWDDGFAATLYADADYGARLSKLGYRVVYDPGVVVLRIGTEVPAPVSAVALDRARLCDKHGDWLREQAEPGDALRGRMRKPRGHRILVLDDRVPRARYGAGYPRAVEILRALARRGHFVTLYPMYRPEESWANVYSEFPRTLEVVSGRFFEGLPAFLAERSGFYDAILVSRPPNMRLLRALTPDSLTTPIVYDAEAIWALREVEKKRLAGARISHARAQALVRKELALAQGAADIFAVTDAERRRFEEAGFDRVWTLGHIVAPRPTPRPFAARRGFLFIGAFHQDDDGPNADSVLWFTREVLPRIRSARGEETPFFVAGAKPSPAIRDLAGVNVVGEVEDLAPLYDRARVFVAPTRFAAGIPYKVHHAAAHGLPVVCTEVLRAQLEWKAGQDILVADEPQMFAERCLALYSDEALWSRIRACALGRIEIECGADSYDGVLAKVFG